MKRIICLCIIAMLMLSAGFASLAASQVTESDFSGGEIPSGFQVFATSGSNSSVSVKNGLLELKGSNLNGTAGVTGIKIAKATTEACAMNGAASVMFDFSVPEEDSTGIKYFGLVVNGEEKPIFTLAETTDTSVTPSVSYYSLKVGDTEAARIEKNEKYSVYAVINKDNSTALYINNDLKYSGAITGIEIGGERSIYFTSRSSARSKESIFYIDNLIVSSGSEYKAEANIYDNQMVSAAEFKNAEFDFGMPLMKKPQVYFELENAEVDADLSFKGSRLIIAPKNILTEMKRYMVNITDIYDADGTQHDNITINFMAAPAGYMPPKVEIAADAAMYRPGDDAVITVGVQSDNEIVKYELYVNGELKETKNETSSFTYRLKEQGNYNFKVKAYDSVGGASESDSITVTVQKNTPPQLEFINLPEACDITEISQIQARITDDIAVNSVVVYINETPVAAKVSENDDIYTFSNIKPVLGDMRISVEAEDSEGAKNEITATVFVDKQAAANTLDSLGFENGAEATNYCKFTTNNEKADNANVFEFSADDFTDKNGEPTKVLKLERHLTNNIGNPYPCMVVSNLTGEIKFSFDIYFPKTFGMSLTLAGTKAAGGSNWSINGVLASNVLSVYNGSSVSKTKNIENNKWHTFEYTIDRNAKTFILKVDGEYLTAKSGNAFRTSDVNVAQMRLEIGNMNVDDYLYFDNFKLEKVERTPLISSVSASGRTVNAALSGALAESSVTAENVQLYYKNEPVKIKSAVYNASKKSISVETEKTLYTGSEYKLVLSENVQSASGVSAGAETVKYFKSQYAELDVLSFEFTGEGSKVGAKAVLQNLVPSEYKTAVMVMLLRDENGAVAKVISSPVTIAYDENSVGQEEDYPAQTQFNIEILPVDISGYDPEIIFLNNWEECLGVKNFKYKK